MRDDPAGPDRVALKARFYVAALLILAAGLAAGIVLYAMGEDAEDEAGTSYVIVGGVAYPMAAQSQKSYVRDLRRFGGKAALLFDDFQRWFGALWRGRQLGLTVGVLSSGVAALLFLIARYRL